MVRWCFWKVLWTWYLSICKIQDKFSDNIRQVPRLCKWVACTASRFNHRSQINGTLKGGFIEKVATERNRKWSNNSQMGIQPVIWHWVDWLSRWSAQISLVWCWQFSWILSPKSHVFPCFSKFLVFWHGAHVYHLVLSIAKGAFGGHFFVSMICRLGVESKNISLGRFMIFDWRSLVMETFKIFRTTTWPPSFSHLFSAGHDSSATTKHPCSASEMSGALGGCGTQKPSIKRTTNNKRFSELCWKQQARY